MKQDVSLSSGWEPELYYSLFHKGSLEPGSELRKLRTETDVGCRTDTSDLSKKKISSCSFLKSLNVNQITLPLLKLQSCQQIVKGVFFCCVLSFHQRSLVVYSRPVSDIGRLGLRNPFQLMRSIMWFTTACDIRPFVFVQWIQTFKVNNLVYNFEQKNKRT